jgi:hypothetical protein
MKPKDITERDHPLAWYGWKKDEVEFINARVNLAYEEGRKDALTGVDPKSSMAWQEGYEAGRAAPPLRELSDKEIDTVLRKVGILANLETLREIAYAVLAASRKAP